MAIIKRVVHILSLIAYVLILLYAIVCIPLIIGYHPVVVLSGSMEPTYKIGSVIYYHKVAEKDLQENDVITFRTNNNKFVSHRIVKIDNGLYTTKGDANNVVDVNKIRDKSIEGKVSDKSIPYLGYYIQFINNHLTVVMITAIFILVLEFLLSNAETFGIIKDNKRSEKNERY